MRKNKYCQKALYKLFGRQGEIEFHADLNEDAYREMMKLKPGYLTNSKLKTLYLTNDDIPGVLKKEDLPRVCEMLRMQGTEPLK